MVDSNTQSLKRAVARAQKELGIAVELKEATDANIEHLLASYRSASEDLIFHDYALASSLDTEIYLWNWHTKVNHRFRETLKYFQDGEGKKKVVERRNSEKQFIVFIKSSQSFYRAFIQRLASHFANVVEVVEVARKLTSDSFSVGRPVAVQEVRKYQVLHSCHSCLVKLGDLSRYRETVLQSKDKNWGPAKGYYRLATTILPNSGAPYHQLAVIAQADQDAFGTTYFLYKALVQPELKLNAEVNLENHLRKTRELWDKPTSHNVKDGLFNNFQSRFVAFHAKCYSGVIFEEHRDLETEMVHEISVTLLQKPDSSLLSRICLTNIAAETTALEHLKTRYTKVAGCQRNDPNSLCADYLLSLRAFHFFQSFNIKLVSQLLRVLVAELQRINNLIQPSGIEVADKLTPIVRCLLPILRQYSSWLIIEVPCLIDRDSQDQDTEPPPVQPNLAGVIRDLWRVYVDALAALETSYSMEGGKIINYLLAEDEETIAFQPFADDLVRTRYLNDAGEIKAHSTDPLIVKEQPAEQMLYRVRQIVRDGINIATNTKKERMVPIRLNDGHFIYVEPNLSPRKLVSEGQPASMVEFTKQFQPPTQAPEQDDKLVSIDTMMQDMVDDLVDERRPVQTELENPISHHSRSTSARNATLTAADLVKRAQRLSQNPPSQPWHTATFGSLSFPSGLQDSASLSSPSRSSQLFNTPANQPGRSNEFSLTAQLRWQQQAIDARSSPPKTIPEPSSWGYYEAPTGFNSMLNAPRSPPGSPSAPRETAYEEVTKQLPPKHSFGAIGETPGRTPTSAQPS